MAFGPSSFAAANEVFIQSRDLKPLDRYFPELHDALLSRAARRLRARRRDRDRHSRTGSISTPCRCACIPPPRVSPSSRLRRRPPSSGSMRSRSTARTCAVSRSQERRGRLERLLADARPPIHLTPMTARSHAGVGMAGTIRGRRARRRDRQACRRDLSARQARDDQGEALAHGRLRRRGFPLAQGRGRTRA